MSLLFFPTKKKLDYVINSLAINRWRAKRDQARCGAGAIAQVGVFGDSIPEGYYVAAAPFTIASVQELSWVGRLHQYYKARFGDCEWGWKGYGLSGTNERYWTQDVATWQLSLSLACGKGWYLGDTGMGTANAQISTNFTGTGCDIIFEKMKYGANSVDVVIDGETEANVNLNLLDNPFQVVKTTVTGLTNEAHTLQVISRQLNKYVGCDGIRPICGTNGVQFLNFSWTGATTTQLASTANAPDMAAKSIQMFPFDLTMFTWHTNDRGNAGGAGTGIANYIANLNSYIALAKAAGQDVILVTSSTGPGSTTVNSAGETYRDYYNAMRQVAIDNEVCCIDLWKYWLSQGLINPTPYLYDGTHPTALGHDILFYRPILRVLES